MDTPREICLQHEGRTLTVQVRRESRERSVHTGRQLLEYHGVATATDEETHQWLADTLPAVADRALVSCDASGERTGRWLVSWNAYSVTAGVHSYTLILREAEELSLEALLLDGVELHPYEYREQVVGDSALTIWAKIVGTEDDLRDVRDLLHGRRDFPVTRRGINDEPRQMRVGVAEWSPFEDQVKYRLVLVDRELAETVRSEVARLEEENSRAALSYYANFAEHLARRLVAKGVLSEMELTEVQERARREPGVSRHDFWRVPDIDLL